MKCQTPFSEEREYFKYSYAKILPNMRSVKTIKSVWIKCTLFFFLVKVWGGRGKFVQLPSSAWGNTSRTLVNGGVYLDIHTILPDPVGGDISPQGTEVRIKTYWHVYYW